MNEIRLIEPHAFWLPSYQEAYCESVERNMEGYAFSNADQENVLEKFSNYRSGIGLKPNRVPASYFWLVHDAQFIGEIVIRHRLNEELMRYGGHIGYGVRPSCQNQGYGTQMLAMGLIEAKRLGLQRALITCDDDNLASAGMIEKNRGRLWDKIYNQQAEVIFLTRRYWVEL